MGAEPRNRRGLRQASCSFRSRSTNPGLATLRPGPPNCVGPVASQHKTYPAPSGLPHFMGTCVPGASPQATLFRPFEPHGIYAVSSSSRLKAAAKIAWGKQRASVASPQVRPSQNPNPLAVAVGQVRRSRAIRCRSIPNSRTPRRSGNAAYHSPLNLRRSAARFAAHGGAIPRSSSEAPRIRKLFQRPSGLPMTPLWCH